MAMPASRLNTLYRNSEHSLSTPGAWVLRAYKSPEGAELALKVKAALSFEGIWGEENLAELRTLLTVARTYSRALLAQNSGIEFWKEHFEKLSDELDSVKNYLPESLVTNIQDVVRFGLSVSERISMLHKAEVLREIQSVEGRVLIVPERPKLGHYAKAWIMEMQLDERVHVLSDMADLRARLFDDYDLVLFPGSPSYFVYRPNFDIYLRALLFSGLANKVAFVSPSWASYKGDSTFAQKLLPGLSSKNLPTLAEAFDSSNDLPVVPNEPGGDFDGSPIYVYKAGDFIAFESGGDQECRFVYLGKGRAYPIEADAKRISVFERNERTGDWGIVNKHPFAQLAIGDIIVACKDRSEKQSNRDRAALEMGPSYFHYATGQEKWKSRLEAKAAEIGLSSLESELRSLGVDKYGRVRFWWAEDAIQPGVTNDFDLTLDYLGFTSEERNSIMALAGKFYGHTITAAKSAAAAISKALDEEEYLRLEAGSEVEVHLDDFGDATYLLAPVSSVSDVEVLTKPSQIRRVIQLPEN